MITHRREGYRLRHLVWDGLRLRPLRAFAAILSIAVTLAASLTLIGVSESLETSVAEGYAARKVDLIVMQAGKSNPLTSRIDTALVPAMRALEQVARVQPLLVDTLLLNSDQSILVYGWEPTDPDLRLTDRPNAPLRTDEVLIGKTASRVADLSPGDSVTLNLTEFVIADTFEANTFAESGTLFMRLDALQPLIGAENRVTFAFLELVPGLSAARQDELRLEIERTMPGTTVIDAAEFIADHQLAAALRGVSRITLFTNAFLASLIVGTLMVLTVSERRRDIAILRAVGWSSWRIAHLILFETALLAVAAALLGASIGWIGLEMALSHLFSLGFYARSMLTPTMVAGAALAVIIVALLGSAIPVYHALGIRVADAIRNE